MDSAILMMAGIGVVLVGYYFLSTAYWERRRYPNGNYPKVDGLRMPGPGTYMAGLVGVLAFSVAAVALLAETFGILGALPLAILMVAGYFRWLSLGPY